MNPEPLRQDDRDLVVAAQRGDMAASERIVARFQNDLTRVAYLLTDDRSQALALVARAFETAFQQIRKLDPDTDFRPWLFARLLEVDRDAGDAAAGWVRPAHPLSDQGHSRYQVDDDRSRLRAALMRLDDDARASLVLSDLVGLPHAAIAAALDRKPDEIPALAQAARDRLQSTGSLAEGRPVAVALSEAAVNAPRADLWPDLESPVAEIHSREHFRSRALAFGAGGVVAALVFGMLALLIFGALTDDGGDGVAAAPTVTAESTSDPLTSTPAPTAPYVPDGDVPDSLLISIDAPDGNAAQRRSRLLDPETGDTLDLPGGTVAGITPDGSLILMIQEGSQNQTGGLTLIAVATGTIEEVWRVDLLDAVQGSDATFYFDLVAGDSTAHVALHDPDVRTDLLALVTVDLASGEVVNVAEWDANLNLTGEADDVHLYLDRDGSRLTMVFEFQNGGNPDPVRVIQVDIPSGRAVINGVSTPLRGLSFERSNLFPNGSGLYELPSGSVDGRAAVRTFGFDRLVRGQIRLPFTGSTPVLESTVSHDGRWLYVISPYDRQVAIVDLARRQLERLIPLDMGAFEVVDPEDLGVTLPEHLYEGVTAQISPDGRYLYAASSAHLGDGVAAAGVWKIDTSTWAVVDQFLVDSIVPLQSIHLNADGSELHARLAMSGQGRDSNRRPGSMLTIDTATGEIESSGEPGATGFILQGSIADVYRRQFGRSPAVSGVTPSDNRDFTSLPLIEASVAPQHVEPGDEVAIDVRFLDPASMEEITPDLDSVRFDPGATVTATLSNGERRDTLILARESFGHFTGRVAVSEPGRWDLTVTTGSPGGESWSHHRAGALRAGYLFSGTDGRVYATQVATLPEEPPGGNWVELVAGFVDAETGAPMLPMVTLEGGMPSEMQLTLGDGQSFPLYRGGHAAYGSFVFLQEPGRRLVQLSWTAPQSGEHHTAVVGPILVVGAR